MRVAINALSTTNLSGSFVILGHLEHWLEDAAVDVEVTVFCHVNNQQCFEKFGDRIDRIVCPDATIHWLGRARWERSRLDEALRRIEADVLLSLSGMSSRGLSIPVVPYAMNPWALVPGMARSPGEKLKAVLQRRGYRDAVHHAAGVAYLSGYMREAYRTNGGRDAANDAVVYVGLDEDVLTASRSVDPDLKFKSKCIISVSAMARHKGVDTLVRAMDQVPTEVKLVLAGGWPDAMYRKEIEALIQALKLSKRVEILGHLSRADLLDLYGSATVFCLMSHCESFGIPSVEAQAFGTPVLTSDCCAMPEVCGEGGVYASPGDLQGVAAALSLLLTQQGEWDRLSVKAIENSRRFNWEKQSRLFFNLLERCLGKCTPTP